MCMTTATLTRTWMLLPLNPDNGVIVKFRTLKVSHGRKRIPKIFRAVHKHFHLLSFFFGGGKAERELIVGGEVGAGIHSAGYISRCNTPHWTAVLTMPTIRSSRRLGLTRIIYISRRSSSLRRGMTTSSISFFTDSTSNRMPRLKHGIELELVRILPNPVRVVIQKCIQISTCFIRNRAVDGDHFFGTERRRGHP